MAFFEDHNFFFELELRASIFLWITAIVNFLELIIYKYLILKDEYGFWNVIGVSFYVIWTGCAIIFCGFGLRGINKSRPIFLKYCFRYLLCSAIFKAIFAILLFALSCDDKFYRAVTYASNEPLLLFLTYILIKELTPLSHICFHVMAILYLIYGAFMIHRIGKKILEREVKIKASNVAENP